jgi:hypothetical protein
MDDFRAPDEATAQARTWNVVAAAYAEREPVRPVRRRRAPLVAAVAIAALVGVAFTSAGHAVITSVRKAIGIAHAQRALYSLPAPGRVLAGSWVVDADGSTRHLGDYDQTSWSPFGRFVVATRGDELYALQPDGKIRWKLGRPVVRDARWAGTPTDTRIAYLSGQRLRIVAGDGTGDHEAGPQMSADTPPAWRPGGVPFVLAYADIRGHVWVFEPDTHRLVFRVPATHVTKLVWSGDGSRLLVLRRSELDVYDIHGRRTSHLTGRFADAAFVGRQVVVLTPHAVKLGGSVLFRSSGTLRQVVPSPDGRWLLVTWPEADQWLFVRVAPGHHRVTAVANIAEQLGGGFAVDGWTS